MRDLTGPHEVFEAANGPRFGGLVEEKPWGQEVSSWWAYEMVVASESAVMSQEENILRLDATYNRVMVNVILKSIERVGRDLRQIRGSLVDKKDPRQVDAEMATKKPLFQGDSEIDQLFRIFRILRTPTEDLWPGVNQLPDFKATFPVWNKFNLRETVNELEEMQAWRQDPSLGGMADVRNPDNPLYDWHYVRVPYCTGDIHWGDAVVDHAFGNRINDQSR